MKIVKNNTKLPAGESESSVAGMVTEEAEHFPASRYFQVHFEHLNENAVKIHKDLAHMQRRLDILEAKIDQLLAMQKLINGLQIDEADAGDAYAYKNKYQ